MTIRSLTASQVIAALMMATPLWARDTLLINGTICTVDAENLWAEAMVLDGETIWFVGPAEEARAPGQRRSDH
ncbi:MAG: hypothetical protein CSA74_02095 [Rhodobacterales bacterium]|nr:MAG: hypothetical protein CSA74_02095 [Rhodobacterales bacterium]